MLVRLEGLLSNFFAPVIGLQDLLLSHMQTSAQCPILIQVYSSSPVPPFSALF